MTREEFLKTLRRSLSGLPQAQIDDIISDYEAHFDAGRDAGRSEESVAAALGDPKRLARELRLEAGIRRWQEERNPSSAVAAIVAFLSLGAIDIIFILPILALILLLLFTFYIASFAVLIAGAVVFLVGPFVGLLSGGFAVMLAGLGMTAGALAALTLLTIISIGLVNALTRFARLHYRILQPAIEKNS